MPLYFVDTEFIADARRIYLVSLGIVCEDGRELYRQVSDAPYARASEWVKQNVVPHLWGYHGERTKRPWARLGEVSAELRLFVDAEQHGDAEVWGYYSGYDFVAVSQLLGGMEFWPKGVPFYFRDLRQALDERGLGHVSQPDDAPHHALEDARWIAKTWEQHVRPHPFPAKSKIKVTTDERGYAARIEGMP